MYDERRFPGLLHGTEAHACRAGGGGGLAREGGQGAMSARRLTEPGCAASGENWARGSDPAQSAAPQLVRPLIAWAAAAGCLLLRRRRRRTVLQDIGEY